jgi:hypothetical protein
MPSKKSKARQRQAANSSIASTSGGIRETTGTTNDSQSTPDEHIPSQVTATRDSDSIVKNSANADPSAPSLHLMKISKPLQDKTILNESELTGVRFFTNY